MNNDDQKVVWKKGSSSNNIPKNTNTQNTQEKESLNDGDVLLDLAQRSADLKAKQKINTNTKDIENIKKEIESVFSDAQSTENPTKLDTQTKTKENTLNFSENKNKFSKTSDSIEKNLSSENESKIGSAATLAALNAIQKKNHEKTKTETKPKKEEKSQVEDIKKSIHAELSEHKKEKAPSVDNKSQEQKKGIEQTYFSDLSRAMSSNEPATMSELLQKARYEKKAEAILSPRSKKNILYIAAAFILLLGIIGLSSLIFKKDKEVKFITKERVSSLVYSDQDTGINTAKADTQKIKQAIRKVVEKEIPIENLNQIYYLGSNNQGNLKRLGIKELMHTTKTTPPQILLDNTENTFMHGVYRTDKNHPFLILKASSYDRAFAGMKEWEPRMIDDLSTYFDLPKEAANRSLLESGFSDDIIKNKNVRVARFLPRDADKKGGILKNIFNTSSDSDTTTTALEKSLRKIFASLSHKGEKIIPTTFAQTSITAPEFSNIIINETTKTISGRLNNNPGETVALYLSEDISGEDAYKFIGDIPLGVNDFSFPIKDTDNLLKYFSNYIRNTHYQVNYSYLFAHIEGDQSINTAVPLSSVEVQLAQQNNTNQSSNNQSSNSNQIIPFFENTKIDGVNRKFSGKITNEYPGKKLNFYFSTDEKGTKKVQIAANVKFEINTFDIPLLNTNHEYFNHYVRNINDDTHYRYLWVEVIGENYSTVIPLVNFSIIPTPNPTKPPIVLNDPNGIVGGTQTKQTTEICYEYKKICRDFTGKIVPYKEKAEEYKYGDVVEVCYEYERICRDFTGKIVPYDANNSDEQICEDYIDPKDPGILESDPNFSAIKNNAQKYSCNTVLASSINIGTNNASDEQICENVVDETKPVISHTDPRFQEAKKNPDKFLCTLSDGDPLVDTDSLPNDATIQVCSRSHKECKDFSGNIVPYNPEDNNQICINIIDPYAELITENDPEFAFAVTSPNYTCQEVLQSNVYLRGGEFLLDLLPDQCSSGIAHEIRKISTMVGRTLRLVAGIMHIAGSTQSDINDVNNAAEFFERVGAGTLVIGDDVQEVLIHIRTLERILDKIDPRGALSVGPKGKPSVIAVLKDIIRNIRCLFGLNKLTWETMGTQLPNGIPLPEGNKIIRPGEAVPIVEPVQQVLVLMDVMDPISVNGEFDLVTQDAISSIQALNAINQTGVLDGQTLNLLNQILAGQGTIFGADGVNGGAALINDYFVNPMGVGTYSQEAQNLQIVLYAEGYNISNINGLYNSEACEAVRAYQQDNDLPVSSDQVCSLSAETIGSLNELIKSKGYLGSGFTLTGNGILEGKGILAGMNGPGDADFSVNKADADTLREGDIVLIYTFLDEKTILIARHESVITEIIKRQAFRDIFNQK